MLFYISIKLNAKRASCKHWELSIADWGGFRATREFQLVVVSVKPNTWLSPHEGLSGKATEAGVWEWALEMLVPLGPFIQ